MHFEFSSAILSLLWARSSVGRAFGSHPRGRGFDSLRVHHSIYSSAIMEDFILIRPSFDYIKGISKFRNELLSANSSMDGTGSLRRSKYIKTYIKRCLKLEHIEHTPKNLVPATQFIFVRVSDNKIVGMLQFRHFLNDYLSNYGGHIGYCIAPSERKKGYAKLMLKEALAYCKQVGLEKVFITCLDTNIASEKVILANNGKFDSTIFEPNRKVTLKRFWIDLI